MYFNSSALSLKLLLLSIAGTMARHMPTPRSDVWPKLLENLFSKEMSADIICPNSVYHQEFLQSGDVLEFPVFKGMYGSKEVTIDAASFSPKEYLMAFSQAKDKLATRVFLGQGHVCNGQYDYFSVETLSTVSGSTRAHGSSNDFGVQNIYSYQGYRQPKDGARLQAILCAVFIQNVTLSASATTEDIIPCTFGGRRFESNVE